jgi:hypothetical protein
LHFSVGDVSMPLDLRNGSAMHLLPTAALFLLARNSNPNVMTIARPSSRIDPRLISMKLNTSRTVVTHQDSQASFHHSNQCL